MGGARLSFLLRIPWEKQMIRQITSACWLICFANACSAGVINLVGAEFAFPASFYSVDVSNASLTPLGSANDFLSSMDFSPSGVLYSAGVNLSEVDPATGLTTNQRPLAFTGGPSLRTSLAVSPSRRPVLPMAPATATETFGRLMWTRRLLSSSVLPEFVTLLARVRSKWRALRCRLQFV